MKRIWRQPRTTSGRLDEVQALRGGCPSHPEGCTAEQALARWAK